MEVEAALLRAGEREITGHWIASHQQASGEILWSRSGKSDPWDHVHAAMGLTVLGDYARAKAAYRFLANSQEANGAFAAERVGGRITRVAHESNHAAYLATGLWHLYCATQDAAFLVELWPTLDRAMHWVVSLQLPNGAIAWAEKHGKIWRAPLLTGSSSIHGSLVCAIRIAQRLDHDRPAWRSALRKLARVLRSDLSAFDHTDLPEGPGRYSMDWYYPVLAGALRGQAGRERLQDRKDSADFITQDVGCRCVRDQPWYTVAETCELVLALDSVGLRDRARRMLAWTRLQRSEVGAYWTGATHPEGVVFPEGEQTTWTAAAVLLAHDAVLARSQTSDFFAALDGADLEPSHAPSAHRTPFEEVPSVAE
jgi:hypothetical protein